MNLDQLTKVAEAMVQPGKGILAADESSGTIKKRFDAIGVELDRRQPARLPRAAVPLDRRHAEPHLGRHPLRRDHPPAGQGRHAARQAHRAGRRDPRASRSTPAPSPCPSRPGETVTEGLDGLRERLKEYHGLGARFAKWRAVIDIGDGKPSYAAHPRQRPRPRPLRGPVPGGRHRADRRARGADGRRPRHRDLRSR